MRHEAFIPHIIDDASLLRLGSVNRTCISTSAALNAGICVDLVFVITFGDSFNRTFSSASAAFDAIVRNLVSHLVHLQN